jgi:hypothetical protein
MSKSGMNVWLVVAVALAVGGCRSRTSPTPAGPSIAVIQLSATPSPITAGPCGGCGAGSTDREAVTALTIQETAGVGGGVTSIAMTLKDNSTGAVIASGQFDSTGVAALAGSSRLAASGSLVARNVGVHYAASNAGKTATLTYTVNVTDDRGNQISRDLAVAVTT